ncbi:hypothetical protein CZ774_15510 [Frigoribacterium sp. JB110]|nr:hypothetical protein CZ774_15510 [Frigoribacterium sp. JB110]
MPDRYWTNDAAHAMPDVRYRTLGTRYAAMPDRPSNVAGHG